MLPAQSQTQKPKRGRGRPPGSKNKPNPKKTSPPSTLCITNIRSVKDAAAEINPSIMPRQIDNSLETVGIMKDAECSTNNLRQSTLYNFSSQIAKDSANSKEVSNDLDLLLSLKNSTANHPQLFDLFVENLKTCVVNRMNTETMYNDIASKFIAYTDIDPRFLDYFKDKLFGTPAATQTALDFGSTERITCYQLTNDKPEQHMPLCAEKSENQYWISNPLPDYVNSEPWPMASVGSRALRPDLNQAQNLHSMSSCVAVKLHQMLKNRFSKTPEKYNSVSCAVSELYNTIKCTDKVNNTEMGETLTERCRRAYQKIHAVLEDEPELMNLVYALFNNSERMHVDITVSLCNASTYLVTDSLGERHGVNQNHSDRISHHSVNKFSLETQEPRINEAIANTSLSRSRVALISRLQKSKFRNIHKITLCEQNASTSSVEDTMLLIRSTLTSLLRSEYDEEKWIIQLVHSLRPVLMRIPSLRNYIINNLGVMLLVLDDGIKEGDSKRAGAYLNPNFNSNAYETCQNDLNDLDVEMRDFVSKTYSQYPEGAIIPTCSGRTELCNQVLNDEYFSVNPGKKYKIYTRSEEDLRLDDYEDSRYEVDMILHRNARTVEILQDVNQRMSNMTNDELDNFQLGDNLGGSSTVHKCSIQLLYKGNGELAVEGLMKFPAIFVPNILKMLRVRDKEWIEFRARWNLVISCELKKSAEKFRRKNRTMQTCKRNMPDRRSK